LASARKTARKTKGKATRRGGKASRKPARRASAARKRLTPSRKPRGLDAAEEPLPLDDAAVARLVRRVDEVGGAPIGAYREPLSGRPVLLAALPLDAVDPTPFQRNLSPTHAKRLAQKIDESGSFLDPIIVVEGSDGRLWTPNGRHRLAAAKVIGLKTVTALVSSDEALAFKILALNTEKAHNLRDRSLEVIRMARALAKRNARIKEEDYAAEFESPAYLTLGILYEQEGRFAGSAYFPFLRRVDRFTSRSLRSSLQQREGLAARLLEIETEVRSIVEKLKRRGFRSPYLRTLVVARINPVRRPRGRQSEKTPAMAIGPALTRMLAAARRFKVDSIREGDLALVAAVGADEPEE
jgi:ParB family chromosome partitioning protein